MSAHSSPSSRRAEAPRGPTPPPGHPPFCLSRTQPAGISSALQSKSIWSTRGRVRPQTTTQEVVMIKSSVKDQRKASGCKFLSSASSQRTESLATTSCQEELGRAHSVAVLRYAILIGVLVLHALRWGPAFSQTQFKEIFNCHEEVLEYHCCPAKEERRHSSHWTSSLHGRNASCQGRWHYSNHSPANLSSHKPNLKVRGQFICKQVSALNGVQALLAGPTAMARVQLHFPRGTRLIVVLDLEEIQISHCPLLLLEGAAEEVDQPEPEDQGEHPPLPQEPAPHRSRQVHLPGEERRRPSGPQPSQLFARLLLSHWQYFDFFHTCLKVCLLLLCSQLCE